MKKKVSIFLTLLVFFQIETESQGASSHILLAQENFKSKNYVAAVEHYRKHLRENPKDFESWSALAACYYHLGQVAKGLEYLKKSETQITLKTYNYFYQGMSYLVLRNLKQAKRYLYYAARGSDDYAGRAVFELAVVSYRTGDKAKTSYWVDQYLGRFPGGMFTATALKLKAHLDQGLPAPKLRGNPRPNVETLLFKHHPYSLFELPHYWFSQIGFHYESGNQKKPEPPRPGQLGKISNSPFENASLLAAVGLGLGPFKVDSYESYVGYHYFQNWSTTSERLDLYKKDFSDLAYQPFWPDLLFRKHLLYGEFQKTFNRTFEVGLYGELTFERVGSSLLPGPVDDDLRQVFRVKDTRMAIPHLALNYEQHFRTKFYLMMRKELNENEPELSRKTFSLSSSQENILSFGILQKAFFPSTFTDVMINAFQYDFIFNDYWYDHTRTGIVIGVDQRFLTDLSATLTVGLFQDKYQLNRLRYDTCKIGEISQSDGVIKNCPKNDDVLFYELGADYIFSELSYLSLIYSHLENTNSTLKIFESNRDGFMIQYTFGFQGLSNIKSRLVRPETYGLKRNEESF